MDKNRKERREVAKFMRRLNRQRLTTALGGNVSLRRDEMVFITASGIDKANIKADKIGIVNIDGKNFTPHLNLSVETNMHLSIYRKHKNVKAIVHAHPVFTSAFSAMEKTINMSLIAESAIVIKKVAVADFELMGTKTLAEKVSDCIFHSDAVIMQNHGVLTVADTLLMAYEKIEVLENSAKMTVITSIMNDTKELTKKQLGDIDKLT